MSAERNDFGFHCPQAASLRDAFAGIPPRLAMICVLLIGLMLAPAARGQDCIDYRDYVHWVGGVRMMRSQASRGGVVTLADHAYVAAGEAGFVVVSVSNPTLPEIVGGIHTIPPVWDVAAAGEHAYVVGDHMLWVVDIANPASPVVVGSLGVPNVLAGVAVSGYRAYLVGSSDFFAVDISDPTAPTMLGLLFVGPDGAHDVAAVGDHAYVAGGDSSLHVVNVSNPMSPEIVGSVAMPDGARGVVLEGSRAHVVDGHSLHVVDVSNPGSPWIVGSVGAWGSEIAVSGDHAHVVGSGTLVIVDISVPAAPEIVGDLPQPWPGGALGVAVSGDWAHVLCRDRWGANHYPHLRVADISNPASPGIIGSVDTPGHARDVAVLGSHAYVADGESGLQVVHIPDPSAPAIVGHVDTPGDAQAVTVAGNHACVADGGSGLQVVAISNPTSPELVGSVDTPGSAMDVAVVGDHAYVADGGSGLQVVDISNTTAPTIVGDIDVGHRNSAVGVAAAGDRACVKVRQPGAPRGGWPSCYLLVVDTSDPASPTVAGNIHVDGWAEAAGVEMAGDHVYVRSKFLESTGNLSVVDISNPASPAIIGSVPVPSEAGGVAVVGDHAYAACGAKGLILADVSTPAAPDAFGAVDTPGSALGVAVSTEYTYLADGDWGLVILPAQCGITTPVELASYEITAGGGAVTIVWETSFEEHHLGFHVERAEAGSGAFQRVNDDLVRGWTDARSRYRFVDRSVDSGRTYAYRLRAIDRLGSTQMFAIGSVTVGRVLPATMLLHQNHPNPFNPTTTIAFELPEVAQAALRIYDTGGRLVRTLVDGEFERRSYTFEWDGCDDRGRELGPGVYLYRLSADDRTVAKKCVLQR